MRIAELYFSKIWVIEENAESELEVEAELEVEDELKVEEEQDVEFVLEVEFQTSANSFNSLYSKLTHLKWRCIEI